MGFITETKAFSPLVTPHRIEFWHGRHTDITKAKAEPQQVQHLRYLARASAQFQPRDGKQETEGCPNDISYPRDKERIRAARGTE